MRDKARLSTFAWLLPLAALTAVWAPSSQSAASYPMTFPWRGDALDSNVHFRARGHTGDDYGNSTWAIDFHAAKWQSPNWQTNDGGGQNTDEYIFGVPLYSPFDGEIVGCWRTAPDKPSPGLDYDLDGDGVFGEANNCVVSGDVCETDADCFALWPVQDSCGPGHDASPMAAGNHIQIRNAAGDFVLFFGHLQEGSIPANLCPLPADRDVVDEYGNPGADGWPDDRLHDCDGDDDEEGVPRGTLLPNPVPIEAGQFIGRVGHSGASSRPHLHMHAKPATVDDQGDLCLGHSEEILFYEAWSQMCDVGTPLSGGWSPLDGDNPLQAYAIGGSCDDDSDCVGDEVCSSENECVDEASTHCFLPDAIGEQEDHDDYAVPATNLHFTTHNGGDVLVYQSSGALRLRSYDLDAFGNISAQDTHNDGAVLDVAAARPNSSRDVVVSIVGNNGNLKHIPYDVVSGSGNITRMVGNEWTDGTAYQVESTPSPAHGGFVVAIEDDSNNGSGNLKVIDYNVTAGLAITRDYDGHGTGGPIDDVAITTMSNWDGVVTAEITTGGDLVVRSFEVPASGGVFDTDAWFPAIEGESVTIDRVPTAIGGEYVVTTVIRDDEVLRLDSWEVDGFGTISWLDGFNAGTVSEHDGTAGSTIAGDFVVAMRDAGDDFRMIGWDVTWLGELRRNSTRALGAVTEVAIATTPAGGGNFLVAARTDEQGELHLFVYDENYHGWF